MIFEVTIGEVAETVCQWIHLVYPGLPVINEMGEAPHPPRPAPPMATVTVQSPRADGAPGDFQSDDVAQAGHRYRIARQDYTATVTLHFEGSRSRERALSFHLTGQNQAVINLLDAAGLGRPSAPSSVRDVTDAAGGVAFLEKWETDLEIRFAAEVRFPSDTIEHLELVSADFQEV